MSILRKFDLAKILILLFVLAQIGVIAWYVANRTSDSSTTLITANTKIYVAVEADGKIATVDPENNTVKYIDLTDSASGSAVKYAPHNVQVAPDGKSVWVTGNVAGGHEHSFLPSKFFGFLAKNLSPFQKVLAHGDEEESMPAQDNTSSAAAMSAEDEIIVIDTASDKVIKRVSLGMGMHLAHVALSPNGSYAFITAQEKDKILKINAHTYEVEEQYDVKAGSGPHGLRVSPDNRTVYIANSTGKSLGVLDVASDQMSYLPLKGQAVQTGVTPDGKFAVASVYDSKSLAVYDTKTKKISYVDLPAEAKGPIQMYPTPDSRYVYLADQGYYFNQPTGNKVYKIDLLELKVTATITAGDAPHGVVVSKDGQFTYVTNLLSGTVSIIDNSSDKEISTVKVGGQPNGISIWVKGAGGTP